MDERGPILMPLGDCALIIRFADRLDADANARAVSTAAHLDSRRPAGVLEVVPSLVSVLVRYDPVRIGFDSLAGEICLLVSSDVSQLPSPAAHTVDVSFGGKAGPDLAEVAHHLDMTAAEFIAAHNGSPLQVLATGFAPGFVYCGLHAESLRVPRRQDVRQSVPAGSILFAAGQTAITATPIPTGWHVIGHTGFRNFDPSNDPPTLLRPGDRITFREAQA